MVAVQDYTWEQGEDLIIEIIYKVNNEAVDLTDHSVRMDIARDGVDPVIPVWSFNSDDQDELDEEGPEDNEVTLDASGNIRIRVPRALTLPGEVVGDELNANPTIYVYDLFLRNKATDTQKKLLRGKISVNRSITRWA